MDYFLISHCTCPIIKRQLGNKTTQGEKNISIIAGNVLQVTPALKETYPILRQYSLDSLHPPAPRSFHHGNTFSRACTLNTGPSWALTVFIRNMSLHMHMSPEHVPEKTISSDQPYTAHIIVSVFPMFPLRPIRPPPEETARGSPSAHSTGGDLRLLGNPIEKKPEQQTARSYQPCARTSCVSHRL